METTPDSQITNKKCADAEDSEENDSKDFLDKCADAEGFGSMNVCIENDSIGSHKDEKEKDQN